MDNKEMIEEIKNNLSIEQIKNILEDIGGEPRIQGENLICRTICHGGDSHKLYYFNNTHLFKCFTHCDDTFDLFQLIMKVKNYTLYQSINYVKKYFNLCNKDSFELDDSISTEDWKILTKYEERKNKEKNKQVVELKEYNNKILNYLPELRIIPWEKEGIKKEIIKSFNIKYDPVNEAIVIPHYDITGKLIGIRERTLIKENEIYGKYKPMILNKKMYNHALRLKFIRLKQK